MFVDPPLPFQEAFDAFNEYVSKLERLVAAMQALGVQTKNVDPFANFAEVIVARSTGGLIQPATNKGFDVLTPDGAKIQVKSLRVSSSKPGDNGRGWLECSRASPNAVAPLLDAHKVAIVVFVDFRPFALLYFPISLRVDFPVLQVTVMGFAHVERLLRGAYPLNGTGVEVVALRGPGR